MSSKWHTPPCPSHPQRSLQLERLEDRTVPSVSPLGLESLAIESTASDPDYILVRFVDNLDVPAITAVPGTEVAERLDLVDGLYRVHLTGSVTVEAALAAYQVRPDVVEVSPDYLLTTAISANDALFSEQWGLNNTGQTGGTPDADIDAAQAWNVTRGDYGVPIAIMDTGIDFLHEDLYQNIWINQGEIPTSRLANLIDIDGDSLITFRDLNDSRNQGTGKITDLNDNGVIDGDDLLANVVEDSQGNDTGHGGWADGESPDGNTFLDDIIGWDFYNDDNRPYDDNGHGTHVAGIIGAIGNNGTGTSGVAWNTQLVPLKWMNSSGSGSIGRYVKALSYAIENGVSLSNNSWSGTSNSSFLSRALTNARDQGHVLVFAAGNSQRDIDVHPNYPASFALDNIVSVTATDSSDQLANFANFGVTSVDIAAPGVGILGPRPGNLYQTSSGTSMSTPFVTGVLGLVWSENPTWSYRQVIDQVLNNADSISDLQGKVAGGRRLNAARALDATTVINVDTTPPHVLASSAHGSSADSIDRIRLEFSESIDPLSLSSSSITLTGPSGFAIAVSSITAVSGSNDTQFDVRFATQTEAGTYQFQLDPHVRDQVGNSMESSYTNSFQLTVPEVSIFRSNRVLNILDKKKIATTVAVDQNLIIDDIKVQVDIDHTYDGDLLIYLEGPDGTEINLSYRRGKSGDGYDQTLFWDDATTPIRHGTAPFAGAYQPDDELSVFKGTNGRGVWILWIEDRANGDSGQLNEWSLILTSQGASVPSSGGAQEYFGEFPDLQSPANLGEDQAGVEAIGTHTLSDQINTLNVEQVMPSGVFSNQEQGFISTISLEPNAFTSMHDDIAFPSVLVRAIDSVPSFAESEMTGGPTFVPAPTFVRFASETVSLALPREETSRFVLPPHQQDSDEVGESEAQSVRTLSTSNLHRPSSLILGGTRVLQAEEEGDNAEEDVADEEAPQEEQPQEPRSVA